MKRLTAGEVHARKVSELGLDPTALDLTSIEAIAGALRRMAGFLCPCTAQTLVRDVMRPLRGLVADFQSTKDLVGRTLDAMLAHGDILELVQEAGDGDVRGNVLLYAAPPSFVPRDSGSAIVLGIAADHLSMLSEELQQRIEYVNHVRRIHPIPGEDLHSELRQSGLIEIGPDDWLGGPATESAAEHIARLDAQLDAVDRSGEIPGLVVLDPERPVRYYPARWVTPRTQSGRFVARRSQAYGADLWCYVQLHEGRPEKLVDLPQVRSRWRGCDEAWRLQLAIDACRGAPQQFRLRSLPGNTVVMEFFSPLPMWAQRRWDSVGEPVPCSGCLLAYRLRSAEVDEEAQFARNALWLQPV